LASVPPRQDHAIQTAAGWRQTLADIRQRAQAGARQQALLVELLVDPGKETIDDRCRLFLPTRTFGLPRQAVAANQLLDLVQGGDPPRAVHPKQPGQRALN
jgi:hypothetical protein